MKCNDFCGPHCQECQSGLKFKTEYAEQMVPAVPRQIPKTTTFPFPQLLSMVRIVEPGKINYVQEFCPLCPVLQQCFWVRWAGDREEFEVNLFPIWFKDIFLYYDDVSATMTQCGVRQTTIVPRKDVWPVSSRSLISALKLLAPDVFFLFQFLVNNHDLRTKAMNHSGKGCARLYFRRATRCSGRPSPLAQLDFVSTISEESEPTTGAEETEQIWIRNFISDVAMRWNKIYVVFLHD